MEEICEILLSQGKVISALNFAMNDRILEQMYVRVLDAESGNREEFQEVYKSVLEKEV